MYVLMSFDLQILFASDLEGGDTSTLDRAIDFAAIIDALDDGPLSTLVLSAGDNVIPGPFFNAGNDSAAFRDGGALNDAYNALFSTTAYDSLREAPGVVDVAIMNAIGFDASALGNHEFDAGTSTLEDLIAADARGAAGPAGDRYVGTLFPYLSANLDFSGDYGLNSLFSSAPVDATSNGGVNTIAPMATFTMEGGEKVAVIGATTPILSTISSPGAVVANGGAGLASYPQNAAESDAVTDALAAELQPVIDQAVASGINKVVLVSHLQQIALEQSLVGKLSGVDVIIAGGSGADAIDDSAAISFTNADGAPAYVVSVPGSYQTVGRLNLRFNDQGVPSLISSEGIDATAAEVARVGGNVSTGSAAIVQGLVDAVQGVVFTKDQDIKGFTDVYLEGNRGSIRTEETNFGNLAADSQLWYARQQDPSIQVSLKNGGGLRAAIGEVGGTAENPTFVAPSAKTVGTDGYFKPAGGISQLDLENTLKFNNNLVRVDTDAAGLRSLMEHAISASASGNTPGQFPQVAGMRFSFDHSADFSDEAGQQRLQSLVIVDDAGAITDVIVQDGELVGDANRSVSMVTLGFLANNDGDSYPFSQVAHSITDITDGSGNRIYEQDALGDYLTTFHGTAATAFDLQETAAEQDQRIINIGAGNSNNIELAIESGVVTADQPMATLDIGSPAEIAAYSAEHQVALATTGGDELALIDLSDLTAPALINRVQLSGDLQSVAVSGDLVAVAVDGGGDNVPGLVEFLSLSGLGDAASLTNEGSVTVGALPDSLAFNADGSKLVVANEGQSIDISNPATNDAEGSISVIDTSSYATAGNTNGFTVDTIDFSEFNGREAELRAKGIRLNSNAGSVAQDIEPEYVTVLGDRAWVSLQENNAIAEIDLSDNSLTDIWSLGLKDWSALATDTSNRGEAGGAYGTKNLYGIKMPDGIDAFQTGGGTYIITANEGDDRDGDGDLNDAARVGKLTEDFGVSDANQAYWESELGERLKLSTIDGVDSNGDIEVAHAFGGRSFSIYDDAGNLVFDSGNQLDEIAKAAGIYDDGRSDDKGMEPEMVLTQTINDSVYAFVGLERADHSAIAMYDVTEPAHSRFIKLLTNSTDNPNADSGAESWGPEGLVFIQTQNNGAGVLMATNEGDDSPLYEGQIDLYNVLLDENRFIGETTALIPEASAADEPHELIDGASGDVDFPFGNFKALATVGEVDPHTGNALTGYPDGQAAWLVDHDTVRVAYQSESYATMGAYGETYGWEMANGVEFTGSHIHTIDYDRAGFASFMESDDSGADIFQASGNLFDTVYNVFGEVVDDKNSDPSDLSAKWGNQTKPDGTLIEFTSDYQLSEGDFFFQSFCGAYYEQANKYGAGIGFEDDVWLTAEEWAIGRMFAGGGADADATMGLASVVVDIANETAYTVPALGQTGYEKLMPINSQSEDHVVIVAAGYNHNEDPAPLKIYVGQKGVDENGNPVVAANYDLDGGGLNATEQAAFNRDSFLARNGLLHGQLYGLAIDAATQADLGLQTNYTGQMMEEYLQNASAPDTFSGRYYPTSYKWDGFDTPEAVQDTEMLLWSDASEQPTGYSFFNGDKKTEHPAADPDITKTRYIQNMTDKGGLMGFDFSNIAAEIVANDADGNGLPDFLSVDAIRIAAAVDGAFPVETGGKGKSALADKLELADLVDSFGQYESGPTHNSIASQAEFEALIDVYAFSKDLTATFSTGAAIDSDAGPGITAVLKDEDGVTTDSFTWNVSGHGANALAGTGPHATRDGSGLAFTAAELSDMQGLYDASLHIEKGTEKLVANDGLQWIKSADHDVLIIDEDSGNDFGERKLAVRIDPADMSMEQGFGYFLAQAGGSENPRTQAAVSAIGGTHGYATSSEFSGTWNVTPLVVTKEDGSFYSPAEIAGTGYQQISELFDTDEQTFIGVVQHRSESEGIVQANKADAGGQVFMMTLDLPATIGETTALVPEASAADEPHELLDGQSGDTDYPFADFKALATIGEIDPQTGKALTGWPDGNAAWLVDDNTIRIAYQSESYANIYGSETYPLEMENGVTFTGSHIHTIDYDRQGFADFLSSDASGADIFKTSGQLFDTIYNVFGEVVDGKNADPSDLSAKWGNQTKADGTYVDSLQLTEADFHMHSLCGAWYENAHKYGAGIGFEDDVWLAAEEWRIGGDDTMGLASIVVDLDNATAYTVPALGQTGYEKLLPLNPGHEDYVMVVAAGYNHGTDPAPLKVYVGMKDMDANGNPIDYTTASERDAFLGRNGLLHGQLYGLAIDAATQADLSISKDYTEQMMEEYLQDATAPDHFSARYYPTSYKWDGFDSPEAVQDTEQRLWTDASEQPAGYSFFNGDTKTEHAAVDPDFTKTRYIQNMTDKGGLLGFDFTALTAELDGTGLPDYLSVDVNRIVPAVDESLYLYTGDKGKTVTEFDSSVHVEHEVKYGAGAKMVAPDGLLWVKSGEDDILIVDEDSGNDYGERKYALVIDPQTMSLEEEKGYLLAQAGGSKNPRQVEGVSAIGGTFSRATTSEFSGSWDVTPLVATKQNGSFYSKAELVGTKLAEISQMHDTDELTLIGVVQHNSESGGQVAQFDADKGGQVFQFSLDLSPHAESSLSADLSSISYLYNPGQGIDLNANGHSLGSNVVVLDPRANFSRLQALPSDLTLDLQASSEVRVLDPVGSITIDAGTKGLFKLSNEQDEITNLGGAGNLITAGIGPDLFIANEAGAGAGSFADRIRDFQLGIDELLVDSAAGLIHFGADAEAADLRGNPLLAGLNFSFTPDLRTSRGKLHVISGQTSLVGAGLRVAQTDAPIVSAEIRLTNADSSRLVLGGSLPEGLAITSEADGQRLMVSSTNGSSIDSGDLHQLLSAVQLSGEHAGRIEVLARDGNGLVATTTKRDYELISPRSRSALSATELQLAGDGDQGADIAFNPINLAPMRIGGTHAGDTVRLPGTEEGRHAAYGFAGEDVLSAPLGGRLTGGADDDVLIGSATAYASLSAGLGNDIVIGGHSNTLVAGSGHDTLIALGERNLMIGGPGSDRFVLLDVAHHGARSGANVVSDFEAGVDKLVFAGDASSDKTPTLTNSFDGAKVMFAGEHLATLLGVSVDELDPATDLVTQSSSVVAPLMHTISDVAKLQADLS